MCKTIRVGMAQAGFCRGRDFITTLGLGSCVGIVIYEEQLKLCGMAHIMLPDSKKISQTVNAAKFADTGVKLLVDELLKQGAMKSNLKAKIAGGAQMFSFQSENEMLQIGDRNVEATVMALEKENIPIVASDIGKNYGRTIIFCPDTARMIIKSVGKRQKII